MSTFWLVAKYVSDLRRREPTNVGVLLFHNGEVFSRFLGERETGIDGRRIRWARDPIIYRGWVDYWRATAREATVDVLLRRRSDSSYFLERGGERLIGSVSNPEILLDDLYGILVDGEQDPSTLSIAKSADCVLASAGILEHVVRDYYFALDRTADQARFDYRFDNGSVNLMRRVQLSFADSRSWDYVHSAAWTFKLVQGKTVENRATRLISLVRLRDQDPELLKQVEILENFGPVINVGQEATAVESLRSALHISN